MLHAFREFEQICSGISSLLRKYNCVSRLLNPLRVTFEQEIFHIFVLEYSIKSYWVSETRCSSAREQDK